MSDDNPTPKTLTLLRRAEHVLFAALLVTGMVRASRDVPTPVPVLAVAVGVALLYLAGIGLARAHAGRRLGFVWLAGLTLGWAVLVVLSVDFVWLAFALFFLYLHLLPPRAGPIGVAGLTVATIVGFAAHGQRWDPAAIIGPVFGAAVAIVITVVYRRLATESEQRRRLLAELTAAQTELAEVQRRAGTLAERERLAGEIHDTVAQSLSSIVMLLRSAQTGWRDAPSPARRQLGLAIDAAKSSLEDTRRLVHALTPAQLSGQPLTEALQRLVKHTAELGVAAHLTVDGEPYPLPTGVEVTLLRAGQEALSNVRRHAEAGRVEVTMTYQPDAVGLDVVDDGIGFDPATSAPGVGLAVMRQRLADVGGTVVIEPGPDGGTALGVSIPLEHHGQPTQDPLEGRP